MGFKTDMQKVLCGAVFAAVLLCGRPAAAEEPVHFPDVRLKEAVARELSIDDPTPSDMLKLSQLGFEWYYVYDIAALEGLEHAANLQRLFLRDCSITDFSVLAGLTRLEEVHLEGCGISDISTVLSSLGAHETLRVLSLRNNRISDLSAFLQFDFHNLTRLELGGNPLSEEAFLVQLPQIRKKAAAVFIAVPYHRRQLIPSAVFFGVVCVLAAVYLCRSRTEKGIVLELVMGLAAAGAGCYLGMGAQILYVSGTGLFLFENGNEAPYWVGGGAGAVFGFLAGVWFAQFVKRIRLTTRHRGEIVCRGTLAGIVLGIVCSTLVHGDLMLAYRNGTLAPMLIGAVFGLLTGLGLGPAFSLIFVLTCKFFRTGAHHGD